MLKRKADPPGRKTVAHRHRPLPSNPEDLVRAMFRKAQGKPPIMEGKKPFEDSPQCHEDEPVSVQSGE